MVDRLEAGQAIGDYAVTGRVGEGGMGAVYLAEERGTGRRVAIKVLLEQLAENEEYRRRFERESQYASSLNHPNIVRVLEFGDSNGLAYMVMEYVPGRDLTAELAGGPLGVQRTIAILEQVASALDAVHATGIYHRDVKPANILVGQDEETGELRCQLTDFGLSKHPSQDSSPLTSAGFFVGTCQYVAPEQILAKDLDHRVDVYSLGCLLYECLAGEPPFERPREEQVLHAHLQDPPPRLTQVHPELPAEIDAVIEKGLAKDPEARYASCGELIDAARAALLPDGAPDAAPPGDRLRLRVTEGNAQGTEIQVGDELLIGRQASIEGQLGHDAEISREHARIARSGESFTIEDLGSTNGTFLNGRKITKPEILSPGDRIQVGATTLVVQVSVPAAQPDADTRSSAQAPVPAPPDPPAEASLPPLAVLLEFDPAALEVTLRVGEDGEPVKLVLEDGRWRLPRAGSD